MEGWFLKNIFLKEKGKNGNFQEYFTSTIGFKKKKYCGFLMNILSLLKTRISKNIILGKKVQTWIFWEYFFKYDQSYKCRLKFFFKIFSRTIRAINFIYLFLFLTSRATTANFYIIFFTKILRATNVLF